VISYLHQTSNIALIFPSLDRDSLSIDVFVDASFAGNSDFSSQLGYIAFLRDLHNHFFCSDFRSSKCRQVTRSILGGELISFADGFDRGFIL
jgi:tyrosyl-tRNA synthetase